MQHTYVKELELLILDKLLPAYIKYQNLRGNKEPLKDVNPRIIAQIRAKRELPALLKP